ncbi:sporulation protein YpjB [Ectobacillus ponti]|uniref:Sporulation protein YpjB n=1 Tax=Ectobacillus ponti TaxID=2961894 RepID=A0AA42BP65_9BACI|nr:sporulation protein YpjB [Ectobacillus ponti]MCP8968770.1 sporulation protein YpjB [Ectobacillus ponti]
MKRLILLLIIFLLFMPPRAHAKDWSELDELVDQTIQLVKNKEWNKADEIMRYFPTAFAGSSAGTAPEHVRVISMAYDKAAAAVRNTEASQKVKEDELLSLRLVLDAATSKYQPLWQSRRQQVMEAFAKMEQAAKDGKDDMFQLDLNVFLYEMEIVYPSLVVDLRKEDLQQVNAHLSYLDEYRGTMMKSKDSGRQLRIIRDDLDKMFQNAGKDEAEPSLVWIMITTGGIIIFTLTYVGWRKYKGEQERKKRPLESENG